MKAKLWIGFGVLAYVFVAALLNGFFTPLHTHFETELEPQANVAYRRGPVPAVERPFVGLALSGGGARAAVFAAAGMEALAKRGRLDEVSHVSSVSGGGFPASYLGLYSLKDCVETDCGTAGFDQLRRVMAHNFFRDVEVNQLLAPDRLFSPSLRLISLQEALDRRDFLAKKTFADLDRNRTFFFNAVSYDTGQRFAFSNGDLPPPDARGAHDLPGEIRSLSFSDATGQRKTPAHVPVSLAIATSAAFPPYLGPMTIQINDAAGRAKEFWHLGDGGVVENTGVETLREAIYARSDPRRARIYSFNAGLRLDKDLSKNTHDISIWSRDVARIVDVLLEYSGGHRETLFVELDRTQGKDIEVISFDFMDVAGLVEEGKITDSKWVDWSEWSRCGWWDRKGDATPAQHLAGVPTSLKISKCNADLMAGAAEALVAYNLD